MADCLTADEGIIDRLGSLVARLAGRSPLASLHDRLLGLQMELSDLGSEARAAAETFEDDPQRLAEIGARRQLLTELRRKYGATLQEVIDFREQARDAGAELEAHDERARLLEADLRAAEAALGEAEARLGQARRAAAGRFASAIESVLRQLAMPKARFRGRGRSRPGRRDRQLAARRQPRRAVAPAQQSGVRRGAGPGHAGRPAPADGAEATSRLVPPRSSSTRSTPASVAKRP